jgi:cytochrome c-type biogenesis protein CcmH
MQFWILTGVIGLAVAGILARAMMRGQGPDGPAEQFDLQVYRDQLKEIERDAERGIIPADEAERLRTEIARRILAADAKAQGATAGTAPAQRRTGNAIAALTISAALLGAGYAGYLQLGQPGYGDLPLEARKAQADEMRADRTLQAAAEAGLPSSVPAEASEDYLQLVAQLRQAVQNNPDDQQGYVLLARSEAALGNFAAAWRALDQLILLKGDTVALQDYIDLADMMVLAAGGYVSPEAQTVLEHVLSLEPKNGVARYYYGLMLVQTGRPDLAFRLWDGLIRDSAAGAPWLPPIRAQMEELAYRAGIQNYTLPDVPAAAPFAPSVGPDADDIAAAADMTPQERAEMVQGMVSRLSERLASEGGPPEEWARLISALGVMGDTSQAQAIWQEAQLRFADAPEALAQLRAAADRAGLTQ